MSNAASTQAVEIFKERLREFLETSDTGRKAVQMSGMEQEMDDFVERRRAAKGTGRDEDAPDARGGNEDEI